jgi:hypothetical protein
MKKEYEYKNMNFPYDTEYPVDQLNSEICELDDEHRSIMEETLQFVKPAKRIPCMKTEEKDCPTKKLCPNTFNENQQCKQSFNFDLDLRGKRRFNFWSIFE